MIDEAIELRRVARANKDYELSDELRLFLDSKRVYCLDTKDDMLVIHDNSIKDREAFNDYIKEQKRLYSLVDSFTYSNLDKEDRDSFKQLCKEEQKNTFYYL